MHADLAARLSPSALKLLGGKDLEYDTEKLEELIEVVPDEQEAVVRAHVGLGLPWKDALVGKALRSSVPTADVPAKASPPVQPVGRRLERRNVADLKPNRFNSSLFPDSLSDACIAQIADDLARNGQRVPVEITPDDEITDGERRWRGAQQLGWDQIDVAVGPALSDDEMLDRVLDACTSSRQMSLREQANVYTAVCERLKREVGREAGRSNQIIPKGIICVTPRSIKEAAAKRAGFSSTTLALRAEAVFSRGTEDLQTKVREGSVTISAAYDQLPKRAKSKAGGDHAAAQDEASADHAEPTEDAHQPPSASWASTAKGDGSRPDDDVAPDEAADGTEDGDQPDDEPEPSEDDEDEPEKKGEVPDDAGADLADPLEEEEPDIGFHVSAVCQHLSQLAELNYEDAVAWFDQVLDDLRVSLGEPPEIQEEFDE